MKKDTLIMRLETDIKEDFKRLAEKENRTMTQILKKYIEDRIKNG